MTRWLTWALVFFPLQHLWGCIPSCPTEGLHQTSSVELSCKTKIPKLDTASFVKQDVLELEISMDYVVVVKVGYGQTELAEYHPCLVLRQPAFLDEVVKELPAAAQLCDDPDVEFGCNYFVHLSDVRVV